MVWGIVFEMGVPSDFSGSQSVAGWQVSSAWKKYRPSMAEAGENKPVLGVSLGKKLDPEKSDYSPSAL